MGGVADTVNHWEDPCQFETTNGDGMLFNQNSVRMCDVKDGTSQTLFVGEVTGDEPGSPRGWYWVYVVLKSTAYGINGPGTIPGDGVFRRIDIDCRNGFSSYHPPGGCNFVLVDGSVRYVVQDVDQVVLTAMATRAGADETGDRGEL